MNIIDVAELTKKFGEIVAVDGITFSVAEGEIFAFLGPNGAGKSTTIKMLTTLLQPTSGRITIDGHDPTREADAVRRSFGIVFQDPSLDSELTARENLDFHGVLYGVPREERRERIEALLKFVELYDRRDSLVKTFSGGMMRRLEIARGLLHTPKLMFLDEPTLGLDPQTRNQMWAYLQELNKRDKTTVFFTTHYMEEAERVAQRIAIIDHGKIVASGTSASLKAETGTTSLEEAFLKLTGRAIRAEEGSPATHAHDDARETEVTAMWRAIYIMWLRQMKRYFRSRSRIVASLAQPLLFLVTFGFGFSAIFRAAGAGNYIQFLAPGIIAMGIVFSSVFSGIEVMWDRQFGFLKETMVAPVPRLGLMIGRTLGGASVALIQGMLVLVITLIVGFRPDSWALVPLAIVVMVLVSVIFTAFGTAVGAKLKDMQGFQLIMNFIIMPVFFLSGALFPLTGLPDAMAWVVQANPLAYGIDALRGLLIGGGHFSLALDFGVLVVVSAVLLAVGSYFFTRIEV